MAEKPVSHFGKILKWVGRVLGALILLFVIIFIIGTAKRGLYQDEYVSYPFPQIKVELPRDYYAHDDYKTEWWYYTGHLDAKDGSMYGFELTFFRIRTVNYWHWGIPVWWVMYPHGMAAHMAITDISGKAFYHADIIQKNSSDDVGAANDEYHLWLRDWYAKQEGEGHRLYAQADGIGINLLLTPQKPPALHGDEGYHWKGVDGIPSYYISYTDMDVNGEINLSGKDIQVKGSAWMDHEFTSFKPKKTTRGWDWFSLRLDNGYEVMLYQIHRTDGTTANDSTGSIVTPESRVIGLTMPDYKIIKTANWTSEKTGTTYPSRWEILLPTAEAKLVVKPYIPQQEMIMKNSDIIYWEGACRVSGTWKGEPVAGKAYVELSGYSAPVGGRF